MPSQLPEPFGLTDKMFAFVEHFIALGGRSQRDAAILAGYSPNGADAIASRLLRRPDVLAYLRHVAETKIKADVVVSTDVLRMVRDDPSVPPAERRKAASELLDRAGMIVAKIEQHHHVIEDRRRYGGRMVEFMGALREQAEGFGMAIIDERKWEEALRVARIDDERANDDPVVIDGEVIEDEQPADDDGRAWW